MKTESQSINDLIAKNASVKKAVQKYLLTLKRLTEDNVTPSNIELK